MTDKRKKKYCIYEENYKMRKTIADMEKRFSKIVSILVCMGGALNDNILKYNNKQLKPLWEIYQIAKSNEGG